MFFELRYKKYFWCTCGLGSLANKDAIARTYRKKRLVYAVSAPGRLRGKSGEGDLFFTQYCMPWQRINKLTHERSTKKRTMKVALKKMHLKPKSKLKAISSKAGK